MNQLLRQILNTKSNQTGFVYGNGAACCWLSFEAGRLIGAQFGHSSGAEALKEWFGEPFEHYKSQWETKPRRNLDLSVAELSRLAERSEELKHSRQRQLDFVYDPRLYEMVALVQFGVPAISRPRLSPGVWHTTIEVVELLEQWREEEVGLLMGDVQGAIVEKGKKFVAVPRGVNWLVGISDKTSEALERLGKHES